MAAEDSTTVGEDPYQTPNTVEIVNPDGSVITVGYEPDQAVAVVADDAMTVVVITPQPED